MNDIFGYLDKAIKNSKILFSFISTLIVSSDTKAIQPSITSVPLSLDKIPWDSLNPTAAK